MERVTERVGSSCIAMGIGFRKACIEKVKRQIEEMKIVEQVKTTDILGFRGNGK